ncbi:MAG: Uma2 family endonuclease [Bacteroidota bacterium]
MSSSATVQTRQRQPKSQQQYVSWEQFQRVHMEREDGYEYEWLDGVVERTPYSMDKTQLFILRNLQAFFRTLLFEQKVVGELIAEADLFFGKHHRRPDVCWLTDEQIDRLADDAREVPAFIIEIISNNDAINRVNDKMQDYRLAGVQVVWQIFPKQEHIHVYTGSALQHMTIYSGEEVCSAKPALSAFELEAEKIFEKKTTANTTS